MTTGWLGFAAAAALLGGRRGAKPTHPDTVRHWASAGLRGVVLRSQWRGGVKMTRAEWLEEFFEEVGKAREEARRAVLDAAPPSPAALKRRHEKARQKLL